MRVREVFIMIHGVYPNLAIAVRDIERDRQIWPIVASSPNPMQ